MSERLHSSHEHLASPQPAHEAPVEKSVHHEHHHTKAERQHEVEQARHQVEKLAEKAHKAELPESSDNLHEPRQTYVNRELKEIAYSRLLNRARKQLSPPARSFSKFIHQPVVNSISEGLGQTVGRPSGIFGGG